MTSAGAEAVELAALAGLGLDPWQQFVLAHALGERPDGRWAAFEVGLVVPRQSGKGSILEARELAGLFLFGEKLLIHSAHEQATSSEHFRRLLNLIEGVPEFDRRVLKAPKGKGMEAIELRGGQRIFFKTRTAGGGRGLTGDFVALDEAMILPEATTGALVPTMAARSIEGNPQLWYAGSAVDQEKHEHGTVLARVRERGIAGASRVAYFEWSAEGDDPGALSVAERMDPVRWAQANPGLGIRISPEHVENEASGALGPREFAVERLGIGDWPSTQDGADRIIPDELWASLADASSQPSDPVCFAWDVRPDRSASSIAVAGLRPDGGEHIEIVEHRPGTTWVAGRLAELVASHDCLTVIYDEASAAAALADAITARGVKVRGVTAKEHAQAAGQIFDAVTAATLRHLGTPELDAAVRGAVKRQLGDGDSFAFSRRRSAVDISPLVAATLALWGATNSSVAPRVAGVLVVKSR